MSIRLAVLLAAVSVCAGSTAYGQYAPRRDYIWARDISVAANPVITLDGILNEAVWAQAESLRIAYGVDDGNPGSGWKIMNVVSGTPTDPANAVIKFLANKNTNMLYVAVIAKDSSVGGIGWENSDGILGGIYDRKRRGASVVTNQRDIFISWRDSTTVGALPNLTGGDLPLNNVIHAAASVQGISNQDTAGNGTRAVDQGWIVEFSVGLDTLGYNANLPTTDEIQMSLCIWDMDWRDSPASVPSRAWWLNEWGNNGGGTAGRILVRNDVNVNTPTLPVYAPDWIVPNGANFPEPVVDGALTEAVWGAAPSFDIQYGNSSLRASYPTIGKDRSGQWLMEGTTVVNAGVAKVKMFFKGEKLYVGVDVADRSLNSFSGDDFMDGTQLNITIPLDTMRDANAHYLPNRRFGIALDSTGGMPVWDASDWTPGGALTWGLALKSGSTINNNNDVDAGYTVEYCLDLAKFGYPAGQQNKMVAVGIAYHDYDITPSVTNRYRAWWFREWPGSATPAFCQLNTATLLTDVEEGRTPTVAGEFRLMSNYPNPFNPATTIQFALPGRGTAVLSVFDLLGRRVARNVFEELSAGVHEKVFDARGLATGIYYGKLEYHPVGSGAVQVSAPLRMVLVR